MSPAIILWIFLNAEYLVPGENWSWTIFALTNSVALGLSAIIFPTVTTRRMADANIAATAPTNAEQEPHGSTCAQGEVLGASHYTSR